LLFGERDALVDCLAYREPRGGACGAFRASRNPKEGPCAVRDRFASVDRAGWRSYSLAPASAERRRMQAAGIFRRPARGPRAPRKELEEPVSDPSDLWRPASHLQAPGRRLQPCPSYPRTMLRRAPHGAFTQGHRGSRTESGLGSTEQETGDAFRPIDSPRNLSAPRRRLTGMFGSERARCAAHPFRIPLSARPHTRVACSAGC
jgi:hypothetical protein